MKNHFVENLSLTYNPWILLVPFLLVNSILTYCPFSVSLKILIFLGGLFLPLALACAVSAKPSPRQKASFFAEPFKTFSIPAWGWVLLAIAALLSRFGRLGSSVWWPVPDISLIARYLLDLDHQWHWRIFETREQVSSLPTYLSWLVFKLTGSTLVAVQFSPALLSWTALIAGYGAARLFFPKSISFTFFIFFAFSYWPLFISITNPVLVWEALIFYCLGRLSQSSGKANLLPWFFLLGALVGAGPSLAFAWFAMWFWLAALGVFLLIKGSVPTQKAFWVFMGALLMTLTPFVITAWRDGYGGHIWAVGAWSGFTTWTAQLKVILNYFRVLFWGGPSGLWIPAGGGFLNVVLGSLFWLGVLELYRFRQTRLALVLISAFFLFLLPGLLSRDVETYRILLVMIPTLTLASIGLNTLLLHSPPAHRTVLLGLALVAACAPDLPRIITFFQSPPLTRGMSSFNERRIAYEVLKSVADEQGPGLIFSEMVPFTADNSLLVCSYPFNAALNPRLAEDQKTSWAAVFTDWNYVPALRVRFPLSRWKDLSPSPGTVPGLYQLGLIPFSENNRSLFNPWKNYCARIEQIDFEFINTPTGQPITQVLRDLLDFYPSVPHDSFLQSCFFEKLFYYYSFEKTFYPQDAWTRWENFDSFFHRSFSQSLQDSVLCQKYGQILEISGEPAGAEIMFAKARRLSAQNPSNP
jgi:hypothetical protein